MDIQKVRVDTTLFAGGTLWKQGRIWDAAIDGPVPPALIAEVRAQTGTVTVLVPQQSPTPILHKKASDLVHSKMVYKEPRKPDPSLASPSKSKLLKRSK